MIDHPPQSHPASSHPASCLVWWKALRGKQWVKNVLLFLPLACAHDFQNVGAVRDTVIGFFAFCAGASALYLHNDLLDLTADRHHTVKRLRPLAAGQISSQQAQSVAATLILVGAGAALAVSVQFASVFAGYMLAVWAYSHSLKRIMLLDILMLAGFYSLRLYAGAVASHTPISNWLLLFGLLFFGGLATQKRYAELLTWADDHVPGNRRDYCKQDARILLPMGLIWSNLSVLVLALYIQSPIISSYYARGEVLWWWLPVLSFWINRMWLMAGRGEVTEDAVAFAVKDKLSYVIAAVVVVIAILARPI